MEVDQDDNKELNLLSKEKKGIIHIIFSRVGIVILLMGLQVLFMLGIFRWLIVFLPCILFFLVIMMLYLLNSEIDPTAKSTWLVVIMLFPFFGALLFWYTQSNLGYRTLKRRVFQQIYQTKNCIEQNKQTLNSLAENNLGVASLANHTENFKCG